MDRSFYTASVGVKMQQEKLNVIANNLANANTTGFKSKSSAFSDLLYSNMTLPEGEETDLRAGSGISLELAETNFSQGNWIPTNEDLDFGILGEGFFALQNPATGEITYTRDGRFQLSLNGDTFQLVSSTGKHVLDAEGNPIQVLQQEMGPHGMITRTRDEAQDVVLEIVLGAQTGEEAFGPDPNLGAPLNKRGLRIGLYTFSQKNGLINMGNKEYLPTEKNGQPVAITPYRDKVQSGVLESSNVDMGVQFAKMIEAQRAYQYAIRMVQTSDEIENVYNTLRQ